jgi:hypothetical protein
MFLLQIIIYHLIELEPTRKFNYRNGLLIRETMTNFGEIESENLVAFSLPSLEIYIINFLIKLDPT